MRILVVEDDHSLARLMCRAFEQSGIDARCESTAESAAIVLATTRFDCVVVDVILPGSSGLYLVKEVRAIAAEKRPPVVIITAADPSALAALDRSVVKAVLFKPLDVAAAVAFVKALVRPASVA